MPNGRPGDHPIYDIVHHKRSVFGEPYDGLIGEIVASQSAKEISLLDTIVMSWPMHGGDYVPVGPQGFENVLRALKRHAHE